MDVRLAGPGNNGDGIVGTDDGGLLLAQNDNSEVVKIDQKARPRSSTRDTHTGGALALSSKGARFIVERGLNPAIGQLTPQRKVFANILQRRAARLHRRRDQRHHRRQQRRRVLHDGRGLPRRPEGHGHAYGENLPTNGIILSPDEKTLYVTNGAGSWRSTCRPDGSLANQREFAKFTRRRRRRHGDRPQGGVYVTTERGVEVIRPDGKFLGSIPTPRGVITRAFGGGQEDAVHPRPRREGRRRQRSRQRGTGVETMPGDRARVQKVELVESEK